MEAVKNVIIRVKYPVAQEFLEAAYWLEYAIKEGKRIDIEESSGPRDDLVCSNRCGFYFPKDWIFGALEESTEESRVLTTIEMRPNDWPQTDDHIDQLIDTGDQNGQLKMWLKFKKYYYSSGPGTISVFFNALKNLKPLKAE